MKYIQFIVVIFILLVVALTIIKMPILERSMAQAISLSSSNALITYLPIFYSFNDSEPISVVPDDDDTKSDVPVLDIVSENLEILLIDAGEGTYRYAPTQKIFHSTDQNIVMRVNSSNVNTDFELTGSIHIFDLDETEIDRWISNQYSNVYDYGAPEPIDKIDIKPQDLEIVSTEFVTHEVGTYGDEYDTYNIKYIIPDMVKGTLFELKGSMDEIPIHVRTKGNSPLLDINSEHVETLVIDTHNDRYRYGPTQKYFHFTDQNIVMRAYFSNHDTNFEPALSFYIFGADETRIDGWIEKQYDEASNVLSTWPVHTIHIDPLNYEITATQLMTHEVGTNGDAYDTYNIKYSIREVVGESLFQLKDFEDEVPVHIQTTDLFRSLDIARENVETSVIETYFDIYHYGPTEKYYHFTDQYAVLKAFFPNHSVDIEPTLTLYIFDMDEKKIKEWIDNQHPKSAIFWPLPSGLDIPEPIHTIDIHQSNYAITSTKLISHEVGIYGDEYDNYNIKYILDDVVEDKVFEINEFSDELPVHVKIEDIDSENLRQLDITRENVQTEFRIDGYMGTYGSTRRYFYFTDQNVLLWVFIPNHNTRFKPKISLLIFDKDAEVDQWLDGQKNFDVPYEGPVQPIHLIDVGLEHYEIISTQLMAYIANSHCDEYDIYNIRYTIGDMAEERFFELTGFEDELPVYVMTKPYDNLFVDVGGPGSPARVCAIP